MIKPGQTWYDPKFDEYIFIMPTSYYLEIELVINEHDLLLNKWELVDDL